MSRREELVLLLLAADTYAAYTERVALSRRLQGMARADRLKFGAAIERLRDPKFSLEDAADVA